MNGALLQARLLEAKARIEAVKCDIAGMQADNEDASYMGCRVIHIVGDFESRRKELVALADRVKSLGDEYARMKGWRQASV